MEANGPLSLILEAGKNGIPSDFFISGLPASSTITVENSPGEDSGLGSLLFSYDQFEDDETLNVNAKKMFGDLLIKISCSMRYPFFMSMVFLLHLVVCSYQVLQLFG